MKAFEHGEDLVWVFQPSYVSATIVTSMVHLMFVFSYYFVLRKYLFLYFNVELFYNLCSFLGGVHGLDVRALFMLIVS